MLSKDDFHRLLDGDVPSEEAYEAIENLIETYPFSALLHLLAARYQVQVHSTLASQKIRRAALNIYSRSVLLEQLHTSLFEHNELLIALPDNRPNQAQSILREVQEEIKAFDARLESASEQELDEELEKVINLHRKREEASEAKQHTEQSESSNTNTTDTLSESQAITLYAAGKVKEAIAVYEQLKQIYPDRAAYYQSQINILMEDLDEPSAPTSSASSKPSPQSSNTDLPATPTGRPKSIIDALQEAPQTFYTEMDAIRLRDAGKDEEAIKVYERLILQHPEKKAYFEKQIQILKGS